MAKSAFRTAASIAAFAVASAWSAAALAQDTGETLPQTAEDEAPTGPEIVVTGSLIRGSSEEAPAPVDVISSEELAKQGNPSVLDLIKNLPTSNGVVGDANQFDSRSQGNEGVASINLRGLGPQRTLVLLNGKRIVPSGFGVPLVDVNLIPQAAIGRIEVLKDGAAATYGSDAIAGVVNFITKENQDGFLVSGDYRYIPGSKGDYGGALSFGHEEDGFRVFLSAGYQHRSELRTTDRDFTVRPFPENPQGGYSGGGNPGNFDFNGTAGGFAFVRDLGCEAVGGFRSLPGSTADRCFTNFAQFDNLVEPEDRFQIFMDTEFELTDSMTLRLNGLWGHSDTQITTSPSYLPTLPPSTNAAGSFAGVLFQIPTYAPALRDYCRTFGAAAGCATDAAGNPTQPALAFPVLFRPLFLSGNPLFFDRNERGSAQSDRESDQYLFSAELHNQLSDSLDLTAGLTYSEYDRLVFGTDSLGDLFQNALAGFGGPNCAFASTASRAGLTAAQLAALAGTNGCTFFNPFSTSIQSNPVTGQVNPNFAGTRNPAGFSLTPGAGLVNDLDTIGTFFRQDLNTRALTRQWVGDVVLSGQSGFSLPGGEVGFAVGGQYRKNYYARTYSPINNLDFFPCPGTPLNPAATCTPQTGALGFLGTNRNIRSDADVWAAFAELQLPITDAIQAQLSARYEDYGGAVGSTFDPQARVKVIESEPVSGIVTAMFGATGAANCGNAAFALLQRRFTFSGATPAMPNRICNIANVTRLRTFVVNSADVRTSGLDFQASARDTFGDLELESGFGGTYVIEYKVDDVTVEGVLVQPAFDGVGKLNFQTTAYPLPEWKGNVYLQGEWRDHSLRVQYNYIDGYTDQRTTIFTGAANAGTLAGRAVLEGKQIDSFKTVDATYRFRLEDTGTTLSVSALNIFDKDPPFARLDFNYDPFTASPLGFTAKVAVSQEF
ncbi:MAG: TonB-dependent receptor plug domain-containing protein [Novosphingobium sp.]|nr:TonB-dependent receptor plug domain-containing protein [Novosphingobium sp.]